jgi:hypothetical protein
MKEGKSDTADEWDVVDQRAEVQSGIRSFYSLPIQLARQEKKKLDTSLTTYMSNASTLPHRSFEGHILYGRLGRGHQLPCHSGHLGLNVDAQITRVLHVHVDDDLVSVHRGAAVDFDAADLGCDSAEIHQRKTDRA